MWAEACEALARAERLHRQFFRWGAAEAGAVWEPPVDIFASEDELSIVAALPGVDPARVDIGIGDGVLRIAGDRPAPAAQRRMHIHRLEIPQGRFERHIALPDGHYKLKRHELVDGCLTLVLLKVR